MQSEFMPLAATAFSAWFLIEAACAFLRRPLSFRWRLTTLVLLLVLLISWMPLTEGEEGFAFFPGVIVLNAIVFFWPAVLAASSLLVIGHRLAARGQFQMLGIVAIAAFGISMMTLPWLHFLFTTPVD